MRKWIIAAVVLLCLAALVLVGLLNVNSLIARNKDFLLGQAEQALGRQISVDEVEATLLGGIGVRLTNFTMNDDPSFSSGDFVRAKDLQVNLRFWPLLRQELEIKRVILHEPIIRVIRGPQGRFNFSTIGEKDKPEREPSEEEKKERALRRGALLVSLVDISGGDVRYIDQKEGTDLQVRQIDLKVEDLDLEKPFSVNLSAAVFADKQNIELAGKIGPLSGGGDLTQVPVDAELRVDALDMSRFKAAAPKLAAALPKALDLSGVFRVKSLRFRGTLKDLAINGGIEGQDGGVRYGEHLQKPIGMPLSLTSDAHYNGNRLTIKKSLLKLHTLELASTGEVQLGDAPVLNLALDSKPASLIGWEKVVPAIASYQLTGTFDVELQVRGKVGGAAAPQIQGTLSLTDASAKPPQFPRPVENLDTTIKFTGQRADVKDMSLTLGKSRIRLAAAIETFSPLTLSYQMSTPEIYPADYQSALPEDRKADVLRGLKSEGRFSMAGKGMEYQGKVSSADGMLYNVAYKDLDATLSLADQVAQIRNFRVNALKGAVQFEGQYSFRETTPRFAVSTKVKGIDVKELYTALDAKAQHDIRGRLNSDMKLAGQGKSWEEIKPVLRGQGDAEIVQGALIDFNIAEGVLSGVTGIPGLTNLISPSLRQKYPETFAAKDTEFKELKADFDLADGRTNVKSLRMSAAEFIVQGNGWVDFERRVDFRSTMNFSQRLSEDLVRSAREVKYLLNDQGQLAIPFTLSGRMPNVKPRPDLNFLGQLVQRGFVRKGVEELQERFFKRKEPSGQKEDMPAAGEKERTKAPVEDLIRRGLEGLFGR